MCVCVAPARGGEDLHAVLRGDHLPGLLLPHQPHPGRGGHGVRGAERGHTAGGSGEGGGVPADARAAEEPRPGDGLLLHTP